LPALSVKPYKTSDEVRGQLIAIIYVDVNKHVIIDADDPDIKRDLALIVNDDSTFLWLWPEERHVEEKMPNGMIFGGIEHLRMGKPQHASDRLFLHALANSSAMKRRNVGLYKTSWSRLKGVSRETARYITEKALHGIFEED
jgi:hypothetical protein